MKEYRVYMLENLLARRYIGLSEDVNIRLADHNSGKSKYTAKHGPWRIIWTSKPMSLSDARKLENLLKKQKAGNGLKPLLDQHSGS
jgi:putative endonuclease